MNEAVASPAALPPAASESFALAPRPRVAATGGREPAREVAGATRRLPEGPSVPRWTRWALEEREPRGWGGV